jgi:hypothetical protein
MTRVSGPVVALLQHRSAQKWPFGSKNSFFRKNRKLSQTANLFSGERFEGWNRKDQLAREKAQKKKRLPPRT